MIADFVRDLDFLAPYLKEKLKADEEHTWENAPYIHEDVKKLIRKSEPAKTGFYLGKAIPLKYEVYHNYPEPYRDINGRLVRDQIQSLESERNALLFSISQEQQYEIIRKIIQENNSEPDVLETTTLDDPCVRTYLKY